LARQSFALYRCREEVVDFGTVAAPGNAESQVAAFELAFPELKGQPLILFLGRVHEKKGVDLLLRAFAAARERGWYQRHRVLIAGPVAEKYKAFLTNLAQQLGIADRIVWAGMIQGDLKWGAFQAAEVFVLPSHQENFGISVAEALSCGLPVLISDKVNIWREVVLAGAGFAAADDLAGTIKILQSWHECAEPGLMRSHARELFYQRYEIKRVAEGFVKALRKYGVRT
jgi:glycosyltransferase involved in cell wall biosynthesis